jgi:peroxiredoxin family protein
MQRSEHRQRQQEEVELLRKTKVEEELKIVQCEGMLNI